MSLANLMLMEVLIRPILKADMEEETLVAWPALQHEANLGPPVCPLVLHLGGVDQLTAGAEIRIQGS